MFHGQFLEAPVSKRFDQFTRVNIQMFVSLTAKCQDSIRTRFNTAADPLGEMDAKELWETTMDPAVQVLRQITLDDAAAADELFSILMGEDVEARRSFITRNAKDVRFLDA